MSEHWLIRNARTWPVGTLLAPLQRTIDNFFIGGIQEIAMHPKAYKMDAVVEMWQAYQKASEIAAERTTSAKKEAA